jgi:hypothetical protein
MTDDQPPSPPDPQLSEKNTDEAGPLHGERGAQKAQRRLKSLLNSDRLPRLAGQNRKVHRDIPLKILVCDADRSTAQSLMQALESFLVVLSAKAVDSVQDARSELRSGDYNTVFIDPLTLDLDKASSFIFEIRKTLPEIVFVLFVDRVRTERYRAAFYRGERQRFSHYYSVDKRTPFSAFSEEVEATLWLCQSDLSWSLSSATLERLREEARRLSAKATPTNRALWQAVEENLSCLVVPASTPATQSDPRSVFLSYRFAEEEYVKGLVRLLEASGFRVITGRSSNTYVSRWIIDRIRQASYFLSLMTRADAKADGTFTTSPWLLEEKGVALAFGKSLVIMIEEGVSDFGGLQGDWQRIHFGAKGFLNAALEAVEQLNSYAGAGHRIAEQADTADGPSPHT